MNRPRAPQRQVQIVPDVSTTGTLIVRGVKAFAQRNKGITFTYLFGIVVLLLAGSGTKLTFDQQREYNQIMNSIDLEVEYLASNDYYSATQAYQATKGWFWSCDDLCQRNKKRMDRAKNRLDAIRAEGYNRMSDAKATAGLFSEVGVGEVKDSFWGYFQAGKQFAKRQSMWDAMFMGIRSMATRGRDESMLEYALKVLVQVLLNFSLGLVMALCVFVFGLWSIVRSYQPDPLTAVLFFACASCAAFAFVMTYLLGIFGAAAGGVYGLAKMAEANLRLENNNGQQRRRQHAVYNRPHHE